MGRHAVGTRSAAGNFAPAVSGLVVGAGRLLNGGRSGRRGESGTGFTPRSRA